MNFQSLSTISIHTKSSIFALLLIFVSACGGGEESPEVGTDEPPKFKLSVSVNGSGAISSSPSGIDCTTNCSNDYAEGSQVSLTASAQKGYTFKNWTGDCSGSSQCTITMNSAAQVQAVFEQNATQFYQLSVNVTGSGTVASTPSGISCGNDCAQSYEEGEQVSLVATPSEGFEFVGWGESCTGTSNCNVVLSQNKSVSAEFRAVGVQTNTLTVSVSGSGSVTSSPAGIDCGNDCTENFTQNSQVALSASPASGFEFVGWGGSCSGTTNCNVIMSESRTVSAEFREIGAQTNTLTVSILGSGSVSSNPAGINCGTDCSEQYNDGTSVTLSATPASGFEFGEWQGACSGTSDCTVVMSDTRSVTATFTEVAAPDHLLSVTVNGNGTVTSSPTGINCGSDCSESYSENSQISLFATADAGYKLQSWSGACTGISGCSVTMSQATTVTAIFVEKISSGNLSIADMGLHEVDLGDTFTFQPQITGEVNICRKDLGHDDVKVDSETGSISWDTSGLNFGRGFYIRIKCSNFDESVYAAMVVHVDKSGSSRLRVAGESGVSEYIGVAARAMTSGDTIVFADGNYPVSVSRDESYENGFSRSAPTSGSSDQYSTIISRNPGGAIINGESQGGIGKQKKAFELSTNSYVAIVGFVVKNTQRESFTTKGTNTNLLLDFIGGQGAGTWGRDCNSFSNASSGECSNAGMRINGGTGMFQHSYDWGHNRYGIMTNRTNGSITRRSFVRLDEHRGDQPYGGFSNYCDTLHLSQDNTVFDSLAIAAPHYKNYAGLEAYPATGCENDSATLKTVGLLAVNNKLSLSLMDQKAGPTHIWDKIVSFDSEGTCTPQTDRCGLWLLQADKAIDVTDSFFGKARGFEGGTGRGQAFGNNITFTSTSFDDISGVNDAGTKPEYLPESQLYYQGRYDTFHGEAGYDAPTTARRWPIAGEDIIAANMRAYRNPTAYKVGGGTVDINGDRGATATGESMSEYFWGYTNDKIPPLVVRVKDKGSVHRVAWEHLSGSRRGSVVGWKVVCVGTGNSQLASLSVDQLNYNDDSGCNSYGVKAVYGSGDSGIAYTESPE